MKEIYFDKYGSKRVVLSPEAIKGKYRQIGVELTDAEAKKLQAAMFDETVTPDEWAMKTMALLLPPEKPSLIVSQFPDKPFLV